MTDDRTRCKRCYIAKRKLGWRIFKKNKVLLGFIVFVWAYTVFPVPLIKGIDPVHFADHLRAFEWGMPPHSGWGLGLDRLMSVMTGIDNVREVVLYPRDPERLFP